jgi:predicted amidohydrolase YtcJ
MELLIEGATIITMASPGQAEAILVRDGLIAAVGTKEQVSAAATDATTVNLDGATIVPGLIDAHCHITDVGYLASAADCSQPAAPDIPAIQARLRESPTSATGWVTGAGYVEYKLRENRHPTRDELDQAVPDRPAVLYHTSLHACVLNSAALREAGFQDGQPDPPGGALGRDEQGRLNGVLFERPMFALFEHNLARDTAARTATERVALAQNAGRRLAASPHSASPRSATPTPAGMRSPRSRRRTRRVRSASASTRWSCTMRRTGWRRPGSRGPGPPC